MNKSSRNLKYGGKNEMGKVCLTSIHLGSFNAPESTPVLMCCKCKEGIFEGEDYFDSFKGQLCELCLEDMTIHEFLKFTGEKLSRAERSLYE